MLFGKHSTSSRSHWISENIFFELAGKSRLENDLVQRYDSILILLLLMLMIFRSIIQQIKYFVHIYALMNIE